MRAPRLHFEQGVVQAEPGIDEEALARIEARGHPGPAPARDQPLLRRHPGGRPRPRTGALSGGGDPRRGGSGGGRMIDFEAEGLLDGLEGEARRGPAGPARAARGEGVTLEELREAVEAGRLTLLPVERGDRRRRPPLHAARNRRALRRRPRALQRSSAALGIPYPDPDERVG